MPSTPTLPLSKSGITTAPTGERHIPASKRADGSTRKEIRIRPGYRPPEDVEVYKNRTAEAWKTRGAGGVPGADGLKQSNGAADEEGGKGKNAKRREARKKAKAAAGEGEDQEREAEGSAEGAKDVTNDTPKGDTGKENTEDAGKEVDAQAENEKQARKLKKKLREARELQEKKEKGEALLHEQFEKVIRINELIRDLDKLGFGADGELKQAEG